MAWASVPLVLGLTLAALAATDIGAAPQGPQWRWNLPPGVPAPYVPADNAMTPEKVELGRHLFYDTRLSGNETQSCATCHQQDLAFTDGLGRAMGSTGELHPRGSMSLTNVAYVSTLTWAHPGLDSLEEQQRAPMFGTEPVELGMAGREDELLARLRESAVYPEMFAAAFPDAVRASGDTTGASIADDLAGGGLITLERVLDAIAAFERTLLSFDSPYDRHLLRGERGAVDGEVLLGEELFFSARLGCSSCHAAPFFTTSVMHAESDPFEEFFNTGLYDLDGDGAYPEPNTGIYAITADPADMGRFRAPTLRNIAVTAPYMHDGSIATLDEVLTDHYMRGGRTDSPLRSDLMLRFGMTDIERAAVVAFLGALTDETFLTDPRLADPWPERERR